MIFGSSNKKPKEKEYTMIKIGLIGCGKNGCGNIKHLSAFSDRCAIAAVADLNQDLAREAAAPYGAKVFTDYTDFFQDVHAVVISSPNFLHPDHAVTCAKAGKHVWIEKPMALSIADADRILAAVEEAGVQSMVGFSVRFGAHAVRIRKMLDNGDLGEVFSLWSRRMNYSDPAKHKGWRADFSKSGGLMHELLTHEIDWMVHMAGMPDSLFCRVTSREHQHPRDNDHAWITFTYGKGKTGTVEGSVMSPIADYYKGVVGSKGSVFDRMWGKELYHQKAGSDPVLMTCDEGFDKHRHFLDIIEGRCASVADAAHGRKIVMLAEKALDSAEQGCIVPVAK